jgi:hypothetical protein
MKGLDSRMICFLSLGLRLLRGYMFVHPVRLESSCGSGCIDDNTQKVPRPERAYRNTREGPNKC